MTRSEKAFRGRQNRFGFTIVELLTTIGLCGLLLALCLPAVQSAREKSRKVQCANNLHQIGLAVQGFESTHGCFPPLDLDHVPYGASTSLIAQMNPHAPSVHYFLLPWLDSAALYSSIDFTGDRWFAGTDPPTSTRNQSVMQQPIRVFTCPSDQVSSSGINYLVCQGTGPCGMATRWSPPPNSTLPGFGCAGSSPMASSVLDGRSNTVFFAERLLGDQDPSRYTASRDVAFVADRGGPLLMLPDEFASVCAREVRSPSPHASFVGSGWLLNHLGISAYNHILPPNSPIPDCTYGGGVGSSVVHTARSLHGRGVHVLLGDGAVRFTNDSIDTNVWRAAGTINGHEPGQFP
jgi:type II secretory pathway pseudopilin PulG